MKKFLKWLGLGLLGIIAIAFIAGWIASEPLPKGKAGPEAEALAQQILEATGQAAWDSTHYVAWNFADQHQYIWDKDRKLVQVVWPGIKVLLNTQNQEGKVWEDGRLLEAAQAREKLDAAWAYFCNDSFWLNAPGKIYDPGTSRKAVEVADGADGLLVTYGSGGVTPGDSYLWILNEGGLPVKWKMWVSIIPIGGIEATWDSWKVLSTGAKVATLHQIGFFELQISDIQAGNDWASVGLQGDPFAPLF